MTAERVRRVRTLSGARAGAPSVGKVVTGILGTLVTVLRDEGKGIVLLVSQKSSISRSSEVNDGRRCSRRQYCNSYCDKVVPIAVWQATMLPPMPYVLPL